MKVEINSDVYFYHSFSKNHLTCNSAIVIPMLLYSLPCKGVLKAITWAWQAVSQRARRALVWRQQHQPAGATQSGVTLCHYKRWQHYISFEFISYNDNCNGGKSKTRLNYLMVVATTF